MEKWLLSAKRASVNKIEPVLITVLRHGKVEGLAGVLRGASDDALSQEGSMQMERSLGRLECRSYDWVATSPSRRCYDFAIDYAERIDRPLQVIQEFREISFGTWEGLRPDEVGSEEYGAFIKGMSAPPQGEPVAEFHKRVAKAWAEWMNQPCGKRRLLVTHAGVMRALMVELFGLTLQQASQLALPEAACLRISHLEGQLPFLLSLN